VLVMEHVEGVSIGDTVIGALPQEDRNEVRRLLYLFQ
jgi:aarF domain-containing kinase